jgi:hypothetical protein
MHLSALTTQSSKSTATAVVMAGAVTVVEGTTMDGVEAIIMVITIGETSLPLMLIILGEAAFCAAFSLAGNSWRPLRPAMSPRGTNAKCRSHRAMSEFGGEPESICSHRVFRILTLTDIGSENRFPSQIVALTTSRASTAKWIWYVH